VGQWRLEGLVFETASLKKLCQINVNRTQIDIGRLELWQFLTMTSYAVGISLTVKQIPVISV